MVICTWKIYENKLIVKASRGRTGGPTQRTRRAAKRVNPTLKIKAYDFFMTFNETDEACALTPRPAYTLATALRLCQRLGLVKYFAGQLERGEKEGRLHLQFFVQTCDPLQRASALVKACYRASKEAEIQAASIKAQMVEERKKPEPNVMQLYNWEATLNAFRELHDPVERDLQFWEDLWFGVNCQKRKGLPGECRDYVTKVGSRSLFLYKDREPRRRRRVPRSPTRRVPGSRAISSRIARARKVFRSASSSAFIGANRRSPTSAIATCPSRSAG